MKERLHWFAMHGFIRGAAALGARRGDVHARLIADPAVAADPARASTTKLGPAARW